MNDRILGYTQFQKKGPHVTRMTAYLKPSRRMVKNNVSLYLQSIVMGLYAVCVEKLDNQDCALRLEQSQTISIILHMARGRRLHVTAK